MTHRSIKVAGIDVGKNKLDIAVLDRPLAFVRENNLAGWQEIADLLKANDVTRVGMEASGGYERGVAKFLRKAGFEVVVMDPKQVRAYRNLKKKKAKTDPIDARLIAETAALIDTPGVAPDERLAGFAESLMLIDQMHEDIAKHKTRMEHFKDPANRKYIQDQIDILKKEKSERLASLEQAVRVHEDLSKKLDLLMSIPCIGLISALTIVILLPELGLVTRAQAALLVGVAPLNDDSGEHSGMRRISGGRKKVRNVLYCAAMTGGAKHCNPLLGALYDRLKENKKKSKVALVACIRKLVEIANAVLARGTPWTEEKAAT